MKFFSLIFVAMFLSLPAAARICVADNPAIMVTHSQLTGIESNLTSQITALQSEIAALRAIPAIWLSVWANVSGTLSDSNASTNGSAWTVTANHGGMGTRTVSGNSGCSGESQNVCSCDVTSPQPKSFSWGVGGNCISNNYCASACAACVRGGSSGGCTRNKLLG